MKFNLKLLWEILTLQGYDDDMMYVGEPSSDYMPRGRRFR